MYQLTAIRLVNWLHFGDRTVPISGTTLLTGMNGHGKSVLLDGLQMALVADLRQVQFNKATGERSKRTLKSYVLHAHKRDEAVRESMRYRRSFATSYVLLQFADAPSTPDRIQGVSRPPRPGFICGFAAEAGERSGEPNRVHFVLPGATLADLPVVDAETRVAMLLADFERLIAGYLGRRGGVSTGHAETYLDALRGQFGRLPKSLFPSLLTKAIAFKPMEKVRDFVVEFLLEEREIHTGRLAENLRHYDEMSNEARRARQRLTRLDQLTAAARDIQRAEHQESVARYVLARAEVVSHTEAANRHEQDAIRLTTLGETAEQEAERARVASEQASADVLRLAHALRTDDNFRRLEELRAQDKQLADRLEQTAGAESHVEQALRAQRTVLERLGSRGAPRILTTDREMARITADHALLGQGEMAPAHRAMRELLRHGPDVETRDFDAWSAALRTLPQDIGRALGALDADARRTREEMKELQAQATMLREGRVQYRPEVEAFRYALERESLPLKRPITPLCELVREVDPVWQDTVEGWLGNMRFDLIVDPADYDVVSRFYDQVRDACPRPGGGTLRLFGVTLADVGRVLPQLERAGRASAPLSEVVQTDDTLARAYLDLHLRNVQRCQHVHELRQYQQAATPTGFTYRSYRMSRVRTGHLAEDHVLGAAARAARRRRLEQDLTVLTLRMRDVLQPMDAWLRECHDVVGAATKAWSRVPGLQQEIRERPALLEEHARIGRMMQAIDLKHLAAMQAEHEDAVSRRKAADEARVRLSGDASAHLANAITAEGSSRTARQQADAARARLEELFPDADVHPKWDDHRARFAERLAEPGMTAATLFQNYGRRVNQAQSEILGAQRAFLAVQRDYEREFGSLTADEQNLVGWLTDEAQRWRNSRLPQAERALEECKAQARVQLLDDVLAQLWSHRSELDRAMRALNDALRGRWFGDDSYQFTWSPRPELAAYHAILDQLTGFYAESDGLGDVTKLLEGDDPATAEVRASLTTLVEGLTENPGRLETALANVTDYRAYFEYDIRVTPRSRPPYLLSQNAGVNSGGEVQTPTYVALFACFEQMYAGRSGGALQAGLLLVDESFSNLDDERIPALMRYLRRRGLQAILAMPAGREAHFAPYADTVLVVSTEPGSGTGRIDDAHEIEKWTREYLELGIVASPAEHEAEAASATERAAATGDSVPPDDALAPEHLPLPAAASLDPSATQQELPLHAATLSSNQAAKR